MALIFAIQAEGRSTVYRFEKDSVRLGASEKKDLDINLKHASEGTLVVFQREGERYRIVSAEGTESMMLNEAPLKISFIAHGDCIKIGEAEIKLSIEVKGLLPVNRADDSDVLLEDMAGLPGLQDSPGAATESILEEDFDLDKELTKLEALFDIDQLGKEPEWDLDLSEEAIDAFIKGEGHEKLTQRSAQEASLFITEEAEEVDSADKQHLSIDGIAIDPLLLESIELASEIEPEADEDFFAASKELSIEKEKNNQEKLKEELQKLNQQIIDFQRFGDSEVLEKEAEEGKRRVPWGRYLTRIVAIFLVGMLFSGFFTWLYYKNQSEKNELAAVELEKDTKMIQPAKALDEEKYAGYYQNLSLAASKSVIKGKEENIADNGLKTGNKMVVDPNDPLFVALRELFSQRHDALKGLGDQLIDLIQEHNKNDLPNFDEKQKELTQKYEAVSDQFHKKIESVLKNLYADYVKNGDLDQQKRFFATVRAAELERFLTKELKNLESAECKSVDVKIGLEDFTMLLDHIKRASTLDQLSAAVERTREAMSSADIDSGQQLSYQQRFRVQVLKRLGDFLLSSDFALPKETFQKQNKALLVTILNNAGVGDIAERDFYLGEFDHLMEEFKEVSQGEMRSLQGSARHIDEDRMEEFQSDYLQCLQV